jgi:LmbE family N-acetylglucosaminyl deacetylase
MKRRVDWRRSLASGLVMLVVLALVGHFGIGLTLPVGQAASDPILIVAPHPDDDLLYGAGIAYAARTAGVPVKVVYMTNGDYGALSNGTRRQGEAIAGQAVIGGAEDDLMFLGYPDGWMSNVIGTDASNVFTTPEGQSTTYASHGLGRTDYHSYEFGSPATYNGAHVLQDLESILETYRPGAIYTTGPWDEHPDHSATYYLVREAIQAVMSDDPTNRPALHATIVHWHDDVWPEVADPTTPFTDLPWFGESGVSWDARESYPVPAPMQTTDLESNPKYLAIDQHHSQGGAEGWLSRFVHSDEIFWRTDLGVPNRVPVANAGPDQVVALGQTVSLDGSGSSDPDGDALSYSWTQTAGPTVSLSSTTTARPSFQAPASDTSLGFSLIVIDGADSSTADTVAITVSAAAPTLMPSPTPTASPSSPPTETNVALQATASASSENASTGQLASKAIDGLITGYPADYTREWATRGGGAGHWLNLAWSAPVTIDRIVLYDRPNSADQVIAATITFSDGSTITTGSLANDGSAVTLNFAARTVTSLRLTITAVSAATLDIGLAEIQVYGVSAGS